jgi:hypothetical protein
MQGKQAKIQRQTGKPPSCATWKPRAIRARYGDVPALGQGRACAPRKSRLSPGPWLPMPKARVGDALHLENRATKGKTGGRNVPLHPQLPHRPHGAAPGAACGLEPWHPVIFSERGRSHGRHGAALVPPTLYVAGLCWVFLPFRTAHFHHARAPARSRKPGSLRDVSNSPGMPAWP